MESRGFATKLRSVRRYNNSVDSVSRNRGAPPLGAVVLNYLSVQLKVAGADGVPRKRAMNFLRQQVA